MHHLLLQYPCVLRKPESNAAIGLEKGIGAEDNGNMTRRKTHDEFAKQLKSTKPNIEILGTYEGAHERIAVRCISCNYEWTPKAYQLLQSQGCPKCGHFGKRTDAEYKADLAEKNSSIEILDEYKGADIPVKARCKKCGHTWSPKAIALTKTNPNGCPKCAGRHRRTYAEFLEDVAIKAPDVEIIGDFKNAATKVKARCKRCNHEWCVAPQSLLHGHGCPRCNHISTSFMEQFIVESFKFALGEESVRSRDKSAIGAEVDVYVPSLGLAIEPGAWVWHKNRLDTDMKKRKRCKDKGIRLVFVYDSCPEDTEAPFDVDCHIHSFDIGAEAGHATLKRFVKTIFDNYGIQTQFTQNDWNRIEQLAIENSRMMTKEQFAREMERSLREIEVIGNYEGSWRPILVRCTKCGHKWNPAPSNLRRGQGCPKCAYASNGEKRKKTPDAFAREARESNPNISIIEAYQGTERKIAVRCNVCQHEWSVSPSSILNGIGCPKCAGTAKKTHDCFATEMGASNPAIEIMGQYVNNKSKITVKCKTCGNEWQSTPHNLLNGHGCPACAHPSKKKSHARFVDELRERNRNIVALSHYEGKDKPVAVRCSVCGQEWKTSPRSLLTHGAKRHEHKIGGCYVVGSKKRL